MKLYLDPGDCPHPAAMSVYVCEWTQLSPARPSAHDCLVCGTSYQLLSPANGEPRVSFDEYWAARHRNDAARAA